MTAMGSGRSWPELRSDPAGDGNPSIRHKQVILETPRQSTHRVIADFSDFSKEYIVNEYGTRAGIVAVRRGQVLLVRQYRLLIDQVSWEIPGGAVDQGETPEEAAVRECLEETGVRCLNPKSLVSYHMALDTLYNPTYLFYTHEITEEVEAQSVHTQEVIGCEWLPLEQCIKMVFMGQIVDSFSVIALLAYQTSINGEKCDVRYQ